MNKNVNTASLFAQLTVGHFIFRLD